eukprot:15206187-Alexandrium_andersonii.AAC.1
MLQAIEQGHPGPSQLEHGRVAWLSKTGEGSLLPMQYKGAYDFACPVPGLRQDSHEGHEGVGQG